ncbi:MAG: hypothetical protein ACOC4H_02730, partial [bacterium]
ETVSGTSTPSVTATATETATGTITETSTPSVTETSTAQDTPTITETPTEEVSAAGEGTVDIDPGVVVRASEGNEIIITYTAGPSSWGSGELHLVIPDGWSAPSLSSSDPGYYTVSVSGGSYGGTLRSGSTIKVFCSGLSADTGTITITYGAGTGAAAQETYGEAVFVVKTDPDGSAVEEIIESPKIDVVDPSPTATPTFTPTFTPTITLTDTITPTVTPTQTPQTGEGTAQISPSSVSIGGTGNTMTIEYTAGPSDWASSPGYGTIRIFIPDGWTLPSSSSSSDGYVTYSVTQGNITGFLVTGNEIRLNASDLVSGEKITVVYGDKSGTGSGAQAQATGGTAVFEIETDISGNETYAIGQSPEVIVTAPTFTATATITPTFTATPDATPEPPSSVASLISGEAITLSWDTTENTDYFKIYYASEASGKLRSFPGEWEAIATVVPTPETSSFSYTDTSGTDYAYYAVVSVNGAGDSGPGPVVSDINIVFGHNSDKKNTYRTSIPFVNSYSTASDIVADIEGNTYTADKIDTIAIWNPYTQSFSAYGYRFGTWGFGVDWTVDAGTSSSNAVYIQAVSEFTWRIAGSDNSAEMVISYNTDKANANKRMLPLSADYSKASDIAADIEGGLGAGRNTKINKIAKWNSETQSYIVYSYSESLGQWGLGTDFDIIPGEAVNIYPSGNTLVFTWKPNIVLQQTP